MENNIKFADDIVGNYAAEWNKRTVEDWKELIRKSTPILSDTSRGNKTYIDDTHFSIKSEDKEQTGNFVEELKSILMKLQKNKF